VTISGVHLTMTWGDPAHQVWNTIVIVTGIAAFYAIARIPSSRFAHGWTKAGWMACVFGMAGSIAGFALPVGLLFWPAAVQASRRGPRSPESSPVDGRPTYSVPGYGNISHQ
jgi:hypothetical protein